MYDMSTKIFKWLEAKKMLYKIITKYVKDGWIEVTG